MTRLLHISDSHIGRRPFASDARERDIVACLGRAIDAAIEHRIDVLLHAGMLLDHGASPSRHAPTINRMLERLRTDERLEGHEVTVVLLDIDDELWEIDALTVRPGSPRVLGPLTITCDANAAATPASVLVRHGRVGSLRGGEAQHAIDPTELLTVPHSYVALGGLPRMQSVQPNAFYSGATTHIDTYGGCQPGGLLVDIGPHTGALRSVTRVTWYDRPHCSVVIEARGLDAPSLCMVLRDRLHEVLGSCRSPQGDAPDDAPVLRVHVQHPEVDWADVCAPDEMWLMQLEVDGPLYTDLRWGDRTMVLRGGSVTAS